MNSRAIRQLLYWVGASIGCLVILWVKQFLGDGYITSMLLMLWVMVWAGICFC